MSTRPQAVPTIDTRIRVNAIDLDCVGAAAAGPRTDDGPSEWLGAGRSGDVYKRRDEQGRLVAEKIFGSSGLTKLVQYVLLGAPNPYAWNQDAVICAVLRRRIVDVLTRLWFDQLSVAAGLDHRWDSKRRVWVLCTAFVDGAPPTLHHPMNRRGASEVRELVERIMKPLQRRLIDAGFDGLAWQAGLGNPVALANFLRVKCDGPRRWAWIDLESGVPALFPASPLALLRFYLPRAIKHRRPLFDDVDTERLRRYVIEREDVLREIAGDARFDELLNNIEGLDRHQSSWHALRRHQRGIGARLAKGAITPEQSRWFSNRPVRWYARESVRLPGAIGRGVSERFGHAWRWLSAVPWMRIPGSVGRFLLFQSHRYDVARRLVSVRIEAWERRGQLTREEGVRLRANLESEESAAYISDFGVHLAIKPFVKFIEFVVFPALFATGVIGPVALAVAMVSGGSIARTLYTIGRVVQCTAIGHERPWVALGVGAFPVVGNLAFPLQIVYSSTIVDDLLAQFLLYDGASTIGRRLPIWGGPDTLTEHVLNHVPDLLVRSRGGPPGGIGQTNAD